MVSQGWPGAPSMEFLLQTASRTYSILSGAMLMDCFIYDSSDPKSPWNILKGESSKARQCSYDANSVGVQYAKAMKT